MTATKTHYPVKREKLLQDRFSLKLLICILGLQASKRVRIFKVKSLQGRARTSPRSLIFLIFSINSMSLVRKNAKEAKHYYLCLPIITKNQTFQKHIFWEALIYTSLFFQGIKKCPKQKQFCQQQLHSLHLPCSFGALPMIFYQLRFTTTWIPRYIWFLNTSLLNSPLLSKNSKDSP